ncbi:WhiB family transcriptional regulator, redox-sensing transcriptional regulator [Actinopolyspora xinjiangensis]|uniref:Transcriptional regulator WhiB n=1 Tax=Actinopolyspora xinjiangensis TaxID=405564 RepID=A0A1H0W065_9ACTN|nr:WhiB family transcriptional regulator [Actinopolyspora xinjiangensis]SDP83873.1 WhiB family transcriptional regulator, redox-sensing transcriptional regulator [Actinopolyspora xinjiangensis]
MATGSAPSTTGGETGNFGGAVSALLHTTPSTAERVPCRRDPDLWFAESPSDLERAKQLCAECPIRSECLAGALARAEPWGVWGGEIVEHGTVITRKRPRGRPRKHQPADGARTAGSAARRAA